VGPLKQGNGDVEQRCSVVTSSLGTSSAGYWRPGHAEVMQR